MPTDPAPADPLARAQTAYASGNFAQLRVETAAARNSADPEVTRQAHELESRIAIDSWTWAVLAAALALFCGIVVAYAR